MTQTSAGLLLFRRSSGGLEVLLVHPGGPYNAGRTVGVWSIPKGLIEPGEDALAAAQREFTEETGFRPHGTFLSLGRVRYRNGKTVLAWGVEGDCDPTATRSNTFDMEWPPHSGVVARFAEVDRAAFFELEAARRVILPAQEPFLDALVTVLGEAAAEATPAESDA